MIVRHSIMSKQELIVYHAIEHAKLAMVSQVPAVILVLMDYIYTTVIVGTYAHKKLSRTRIQQHVILAKENASSVLGLQLTTVQVVKQDWCLITLLAVQVVLPVILSTNGTFVSSRSSILKFISCLLLVYFVL